MPKTPCSGISLYSTDVLRAQFSSHPELVDVLDFWHYRSSDTFELKTYLEALERLHPGVIYNTLHITEPDREHPHRHLLHTDGHEFGYLHWSEYPSSDPNRPITRWILALVHTDQSKDFLRRFAEESLEGEIEER